MKQNSIQYITSDEMDKIIETYEPEGLFIAQEGDGFTAIDNNSGEAYTEYFKTKAEAELWLRNPGIFGVPIYKDGYAVLTVEITD